MTLSSIITGKVLTSIPSASSGLSKQLYIKILPGEFWLRSPTPKKAKVLGGELLVRYSARQWPEKKNGPLVGDKSFLKGVSLLLTEVNLVNVTDISWAKEQKNLKETVTIKVGKLLAKELLDRGFGLLDNPPTE